jgi:DNA-directed RNA polymerase subunit N (RpoN/RPB10)
MMLGIDPARCFQCGAHNVTIPMVETFTNRVSEGTSTPLLCGRECLINWHKSGYVRWCITGQRRPPYLFAQRSAT